MLIQVDGWFGSGKSVLWMLLDGHPDVFCSPIHDFSYSAFLSQSDAHEWVTTRHTEILRKALARTQYYKFEKAYWDGFQSFEFSTTEVLRLPYTCNYYRFDEAFFTALMKRERWTICEITDLLYGSVYREVHGLPQDSALPRFFAAMSHAHLIEEYSNFPVLFPGSKSIQVRRSVENIVATRSNRKPKPEDFKTKNFFSGDFETRIAEGEVEKILAYYDRYDALMKQYPDVFTTVEFDDLVMRTEPTMRRMAEFLDIPFHPELLRATYCGTEIEYNGKKYIGQENDHIDTLLSPDERQIIRDRMAQYHAAKANPL